MTLTKLKQDFKKALSKIEIDETLHSYSIFYAGAWAFARTDEKRREVIENINNGTLKSYEDVVKFI